MTRSRLLVLTLSMLTAAAIGTFTSATASATQLDRNGHAALAGTARLTTDDLAVRGYIANFRGGTNTPVAQGQIAYETLAGGLGVLSHLDRRGVAVRTIRLRIANERPKTGETGAFADPYLVRSAGRRLIINALDACGAGPTDSLTITQTASTVRVENTAVTPPNTACPVLTGTTLASSANVSRRLKAPLGRRTLVLVHHDAQTRADHTAWCAVAVPARRDLHAAWLDETGSVRLTNRQRSALESSLLAEQHQLDHLTAVPEAAQLLGDALRRYRAALKKSGTSALPQLDRGAFIALTFEHWGTRSC